MIKEKSLKEFRESGLFWLVNNTLHVFGWALVMDLEDGEYVRMYPARVKFRGFSELINTDGYIKVSKYMKENAEELEKEAKE